MQAVFCIPCIRGSGETFISETRVSSYISNAERQVAIVIRDIDAEVQSYKQAKSKQLKIELINKAHSIFIKDKDPQRIFLSVLPDLLAMTKSQLGFVGAFTTTNNESHLTVYAACGCNTSVELDALIQRSLTQSIDISQKKTLFSDIALGDVVLMNDQSELVIQAPGHPEIQSFIGFAYSLW